MCRSGYETGRLNLRAFRVRKFRNFSRNRPETTNLNHQYAIRRVLIDRSLMCWSSQRITDSAKAGEEM